MPASETTSARDEVTPPNVAHAYPPGKNPAPKLLLLAIIVGSILALLIHRLDHPIKSGIVNKVASFAGVSEATSGIPSMAVCYSGHLGTFPHVFHQNLDVIRTVDKNADIFFYVDPKDDYHHERSGEHYVEEHDLGVLQPMFDAMKAKVVRTFSTQAIKTPEPSECYMREGTDESHYSHHFMQFYAAQECYKMIKAEEEATGRRYEWILRLQPNMRIQVMLPQPDKEPRVHMSGTAISLVPRGMADDFFSAVQAFEPQGCGPLDQLGGGPCENYSYEHGTPECLLIKWLSMADIIPSNGVFVKRRIMYPTAPENPDL
ncbi:hypothetical protein FGB62_223g07 [Gracilaria domingensis]|nr:hypothetical protein FGB62_223g07 [Gracilaria domingensis]